MRKNLMVSMVMVLVLAIAALAVAAEMGKMDLKVGDEIYVCGCGAGCPCDTMSRKQAKCACNKEMVKSKVTKVESGKAYFVINGEEQAFLTTGKYACPCGEGCNCGTISQQPGKCACGKVMKQVK